MSVKQQFTFAPIVHRARWPSADRVATATVILNKIPRALVASAAGLFPPLLIIVTTSIFGAFNLIAFPFFCLRPSGFLVAGSP